MPLLMTGLYQASTIKRMIFFFFLHFSEVYLTSDNYNLAVALYTV